VKAFDLENRVRDCYWTDLGFLRRGRETFMRRLWRKAEPEMARLLEATPAWELTAWRRAEPADEAEVRERRRQMDGAKATAAGSARGTTGRSTFVLSPTSSRTQKVYSVQP